MMILYDDHMWWSHLIVIWSSCLLIMHNHHIWSWMMIMYHDHLLGIITYEHYLLSSYMMSVYDDHHIWCSYMMTIHGDKTWQLYMIIIYDDHMWSSCLMITTPDLCSLWSAVHGAKHGRWSTQSKLCTVRSSRYPALQAEPQMIQHQLRSDP